MDGDSLQNPTLKKPRWVKGFLKALALTGNVTKAAQAAKIDRTVPYDYRQQDQEFAGQWEDAIDEAADHLEEEARRRAYVGLMRKKFDKGQPIIDPETGEQYVEMEYSDTLLIFLLKGARPDKFRERSDVNVTAGGTLEVFETIVDAPPGNPPPPGSVPLPPQ